MIITTTLLNCGTVPRNAVKAESKSISRKDWRNSQETGPSMASKHGAFGPILA